MNKENMSEVKVVLWGVGVSPYVRKVMVALAEKNIAFEQREILPKMVSAAIGQTVPTEFLNVSPLGKIPALQVNDFCISDSGVICQYIDKKFGVEHTLYPTNPEAHAKALWFEKYADTEMTDIIYKKIFVENVIKPVVLQQETNKKIVDDAIAEELPSLLDYLDRSVAHSQWLAGEIFSVGDVAVITQLLALKMAGVEIDPLRWKALAEYMVRAMERASVKQFLSN